MAAKLPVLIAGFLCLAVTGAAPALAQSVYPGGVYAPATGVYAPPPYAGGRPEIVITPRHPLYRRCAERLELQYRPSGPVLFPLTYCWWVRG